MQCPLYIWKKKRKNKTKKFHKEWNGWANEHLFIPSNNIWLVRYAKYGMNQIEISHSFKEIRMRDNLYCALEQSFVRD